MLNFQASHGIRGSRLKIHPKVQSLLDQVEDLKIFLDDKKPYENLHSEVLDLDLFDNYDKNNEREIWRLPVKNIIRIF